MKCPECKYKIPEDSTFCYKCGCQVIKGTNGSEVTCVMDSERKLVTIMFSDMSGYTAMAERLDPEEVKRIMSQIFSEITEIIKRYDGFIEKFIGDAVMAVFGVPKSHEDDPVRAIRAAMEIHLAVEDFSPRFEEKIGSPLSMHTGINTGLVVTGEVDVEKGTHGLTGDAINLASRIEGLAKPGEVLVGESTYQLARQYFEFKTLESTKVKGKTKPIEAFKVVSPLDQHSLTMRLQGVQADLIGRETEMNLLLDAVENLKQGNGSIISIVGHAGTGKSRLTREFKDRINLDEVQWREGHAYAYTQNIAYYPLTNLLTHAFQIREGDNPEQVRIKVESGVKELLWDKPDAKEYIGRLFSLSYAKQDEMAPEFWQAQLRQSIQQILEALAGRGPTVILFEDLHWADASFVELLCFLLKNTQRPVVFLCVYRPSFSLLSDSTDSLPWHHHQIELHDMSWDHTQAMLKSLLGSSQLPDELRYFIKKKVEGNPFYLEEVINSLIETEILIPDNGDWQLTKPLNLADIPPTIQGVLTARLDRLERETKRILQEASVIGRAFFYEVLTRVTELTKPVDDCLLGLESLDLIRTRSKEPDLEYIFKHALTQEVVYNGLLKTERQEIHERIGLAIEHLFQDRLPEFYENLAFHFKNGKNVSKAVGYLVKSGEKSLKRFAVEESHNYFKSAFEIIQRRKDRSKNDNERLVDLLSRWGLVYYCRGATLEYESLMSSQENIVKTIDDNNLIGLFYAWQGMSLWLNGKIHQSYACLQKAKRIGKEVENDLVVGYAKTWLSWVCGEMGNFKEGIKNGEEAHKIAKKIKTDPYLYFKSLAGVGYNYFWNGKANASQSIVKSLFDYGNRYGDTRCLVLAYQNEGFMHTSAGDLQEAIRVLKKGVDVSVDPFYNFAAMMPLCFAYVQANQMKEAEIVFKSVTKFCMDAGCNYHKPSVDMFSALIKINNGELSQGMNALLESINTAKYLGSEAVLPIQYYAVAKVYLEIVKGEKQTSFLTLIRNPGFIMRHAPFATKRAEKYMLKAITFGKTIGAIGIVAQVHMDLGIFYKLKKRYQDARYHLEKAIKVFNETGAYVFLDQAEAELVSIR